MGRKRSADINRALAAAAVDAVFTLEMAAKAKVAKRSVSRRVKNGQLVRLGYATYRFAGAPQTRRTLERAGLLIVDAKALAIWSASGAHGCVPQPKKVHVAIEPGRRVEPPSWLSAHRLRPLEDDEIVELHDLPVTTMARAIRDHAAVLREGEWAERQLRQLASEALILGKLKLDDLGVMLDRERGARAARRLEHIISYETGRDTADLKSRGEQWLRELVIARGWPMPQFNARIPGTNHDGDAYWAEQGVVVEFDGFSVHRNRKKFDADRRRDRLVRRSGITTIRITSTDFRDHRDELADDLARALGL